MLCLYLCMGWSPLIPPCGKGFLVVPSLVAKSVGHRVRVVPHLLLVKEPSEIALQGQPDLGDWAPLRIYLSVRVFQRGRIEEEKTPHKPSSGLEPGRGSEPSTQTCIHSLCYLTAEAM